MPKCQNLTVCKREHFEPLATRWANRVSVLNKESLVFARAFDPRADGSYTAVRTRLRAAWYAKPAPPARKTPNPAFERTPNGLATLFHLHAPVRAVTGRSTLR